MKPEIFKLLVTALSKFTPNIRGYTGRLGTGVHAVPDTIVSQIGKILFLVQEQINQGKLCDKHSQYLLLYNFQPAYLDDNLYICDLSFVIKPLANLLNIDVDDTLIITGITIQLALDGNTGEVFNSSYLQEKFDLLSIEEVESKQLPPPEVYGNYQTLEDTYCFAAVVCLNAFRTSEELLDEKYSQTKMFLDSRAFRNYGEAETYLANRKELGRYILLVNCAKKNYPLILSQGLNKFILGLANYFADEAVTEFTKTPRPEGTPPSVIRTMSHLYQRKQSSPKAASSKKPTDETTSKETTHENNSKDKSTKNICTCVIF